MAAQIIKTGQIYSIEASPSTFEILKYNCRQCENIFISNIGIDSENTTGKFYEFPVKYSEYNCKNDQQFFEAKWYKKAKVLECRINYKTLDHYIKSKSIVPNIIKIHAEGNEYNIMKGMRNLLSEHSKCIIIMEFINDNRSNAIYFNAADLLRDNGFLPYAIDTNGNLTRIYSIKEYFNESKLNSDNLVFKRQYNLLNKISI